MLLGDITGDGRLDFVMMQGDQMADDRYIGHQINALTAYDFEGNLLWQVGNPARGESTGSDIPAQIYDIDQDGENEVLACMNNDLVSQQFAVLDGKTGEVEATFDYPSPDAHDAIIIANFSGTERPTDIVLKDRYSNLWAMDRDWNVLFQHTGNIGHYPWPADYDADGRDELMAGYDYLESDGGLSWQVNQGGHADCIWVGDVDQNPDNGREIALGGEDITVYGSDGSLIARENMPIEPQNIAIGDFRPDLPGLEIAGQDRRDRGTPGEEAIFCWSPMTGEMLFYNVRPGWGSIANMVHDWDGTGSDFISIWRGPSAPTLFDGQGAEVVTFAEGYLMNADVDGDGTQEVMTFTDRSVVLYSHDPIDLAAAKTGVPRPQAKMQYNFTRYWGGEYPPDALIAATGGAGGTGGSGGVSAGGTAGAADAGGTGGTSMGGTRDGGTAGTGATAAGGMSTGGQSTGGVGTGGVGTGGTGIGGIGAGGISLGGALTGGTGVEGPGTGGASAGGATTGGMDALGGSGGSGGSLFDAGSGAAQNAGTGNAAGAPPSLDAGTSSDNSGCGCRVSSSSQRMRGWPGILLAIAAAAVWGRRWSRSNHCGLGIDNNLFMHGRRYLSTPSAWAELGCDRCVEILGVRSTIQDESTPCNRVQSTRVS